MGENKITDHNSIIKFLAKKFNLTEDIIENIVRTQFRFVKDTMEQGELESVHLHHLGKFCVKPGRIDILRKKGYVPKTKKV